MPRLAIVTLTALVMLGGCTSSDDKGGGSSDGTAKPSATTSTPAPTGPDCADIWKAGLTLPKDYTKCVEDGAYGLQDVTECQDGSRLVVFSDTLFAVTGEPISKPDVAPLQDTEAFGLAYTACTGE
ncbi:hypothetical protein [Aeromicrobium sp. NPDC092404]|uniref:hypothetical protein n=1 Tax=Aeromicrobium sp. NPDC092404 TaxID=3154976 RepID=UPI0034391CCC